MIEDIESMQVTPPQKDIPQRLPATGENLCTACEGRGLINDRTCALCGGTGHLPVPMGGV